MNYLFFGESDKFSLIESAIGSDLLFADSYDLFFDLLSNDETLVFLDFDKCEKEAAKINKTLFKKYPHVIRAIISGEGLPPKKEEKHKTSKEAAKFYLSTPLEPQVLRDVLEDLLRNENSFVKEKEELIGELAENMSGLFSNESQTTEDSNMGNLAFDSMDPDSETSEDEFENNEELSIKLSLTQDDDVGPELDFTNNEETFATVPTQNLNSDLNISLDLEEENISSDDVASFSLDDQLEGPPLNSDEGVSFSLDDQLEGNPSEDALSFSLDGEQDELQDQAFSLENQEVNIENEVSNNIDDFNIDDNALGDLFDTPLEDLKSSESSSHSSSDDFEEVTFSRKDIANIFEENSSDSDDENDLFDLSVPEASVENPKNEYEADLSSPVEEGPEVNFLEEVNLEESVGSLDEEKTRILTTSILDEDAEKTKVYNRDDFLNNSLEYDEEETFTIHNSITPENMAKETMMGVENFANEAMLGGEDLSQKFEEPIISRGNDLQKVSQFHENEYLRIQGMLKKLREERNNVQDENIELKEKIKIVESEKLKVQAELDEAKIELSIIRRRHQSELEEARYQAELNREKRQIYEEKSKSLQQDLERLAQRIRIDINKVRQRERELEGQLELVSMDTESQIRSRDKKILDLKRKIDSLEFNMENVSIREEQSQSEKRKLEEKLSKIMKTIRGSIDLLEDDFDGKNSSPTLHKVK